MTKLRTKDKVKITEEEKRYPISVLQLLGFEHREKRRLEKEEKNAISVIHKKLPRMFKSHKLRQGLKLIMNQAAIHKN